MQLLVVHQTGGYGDQSRILQLARAIRRNLTHGLHHSQHGSLQNVFTLMP